MPADRRLANARLVLPDRVVAGAVDLRGGTIAAVEDGAAGGGEDLGGDLLLPGLIELHTDNLEKHYSPRAGVVWDPVAAAIAHDAQIAGSGITTVFDSLVIGAADGWEMREDWLRPMLGGLARARAAGMLRVDHRLHLRCELTHPEVPALLEGFLGEPGLAMISLMDHAPGDRQSPDIPAYRRRYRKTFGGDDAAVDAHVYGMIERSRRHAAGNRRSLCDLARRHGLAVASHDDATPEHVAEAAGLGCAISEFPTTAAAARAARAHGLHVLMGAPNLIRGGSHSGNVAASDLAQGGLLDLLSSDYIPGALLLAAFRLAGEPFGYPLPAAVAAVSATPAAAAGLADRGRIAVGLRADLVRVRLMEGQPVIRGVWVGGERVG